VFVPAARQPAPPRVEWPAIHLNDAQDDIDLMVLHQLADVSGILNGGALQLNVRCNYGTGILPSLFGAELFTMPREPDLVQAFLRLISDTYIAFMRAWYKLVPPPDYSTHWGLDAPRPADVAQRFADEPLARDLPGICPAV